MRCSNEIYDSRVSWRCGRDAIIGGDLCRVCYAARKRGEARRATNEQQFKAESDARRDQYQQEQTARERRARKLAAFDDLLKAAEAVIEKCACSTPAECWTLGHNDLRAAIAKAKEAQK